MKLIVFSILFLSLSSCGKGSLTQLFSKGTDSLSNESHTSDISVYLEELGEFKSIPDLNQEPKVLSFLDKVIFLNLDYFLEKKNSLQTADFLKKEDIEKNEQEIQLSSKSFCSESLKGLQEGGEKSRYLKKLISTSPPSYVDIISLIPRELLSKKMNQNIYCSFIFEFKDKKTYLLMHQEINTSFPKKNYYKVSLLNFEKEFHSVQTGDLLKKEDLENIMIDSEGQEEVSQYELFCDGLFLFSTPISSSSIEQRYAFKNLFKNQSSDISLSSNKIQNCVFYATHNENIRAISPHFQIDFSSLSLLKERVDLSEIGKPFIKGSDLFAKMKFRYFNRIKDKKDYSHIEMVVDSKCFDPNYYTKKIFTKNTRLPLSEETPIMAFVPEEIFFLLSLNKSSLILHKELIKNKYSMELQIIKERKTIHPTVEDVLDKGVKEARRRELSDKIYELELDGEESKDINEIKHSFSKFQCVFSLKLEDKTKPDNQRIFKDRFSGIKLKNRTKSLSGYKIDYINNMELKKDFIFKLSYLDNWAEKSFKSSNTDKLNLKYRTYKPHLFHLDDIRNIDYYLGSFKIDSLEKISVDKVTLKCHIEKLEKGMMNYDREDFEFVKSNWDVDFINRNHFIPLKNLLNNKRFKEKLNEIKEETRDDYLSVCRLFLYSSYNQEFFLKYFSPEIRFLY